MRKASAMESAIMWVAAAATAAVLASGCAVPADRATATLDAMGFASAAIGGAAPFACGETDDDDEMIGVHFVATNTAGRRVTGVVCCGYFKSCAVRF